MLYRPDQRWVLEIQAGNIKEVQLRPLISLLESRRSTLSRYKGQTRAEGQEGAGSCGSGNTAPGHSQELGPQSTRPLLDRTAESKAPGGKGTTLSLCMFPHVPCGVQDSVSGGGTAHK